MNTSSSSSTPTIKVIIKFVWLAPLIIMALLVAACSSISNEVFDNRINEGIIEYSISFPDLGEESITASLLPESMTYAFNEFSFASNFEAAGGVFKNRIIANSEEKTVEHQLKIFRKKIKVEMDDTEVMQMLAAYPKMTVIETDDTDSIAGYACQKALIVFEQIDMPEIEIFYTTDINMITPNWCTQYRDIDGVLMAYEIEEFGIRMRLEAQSVEHIALDPEIMQSEAEYTPISRETMDIELSQLVETFQF